MVEPVSFERASNRYVGFYFKACSIVVATHFVANTYSFVYINLFLYAERQRENRNSTIRRDFENQVSSGLKDVCLTDKHLKSVCQYIITAWVI